MDIQNQYNLNGEFNMRTVGRNEKKQRRFGGTIEID